MRNVQIWNIICNRICNTICSTLICRIYKNNEINMQNNRKKYNMQRLGKNYMQNMQNMGFKLQYAEYALLTDI